MDVRRSHMSKKKIGTIIGVVIGVVALAGVGFYFSTQMTMGGSSENRVYVEQVSSIMNVNAGMTNRYNGVVESQDTHEINVDSSRQIETIHVEVGQEIEKGQKLVTYDISDQQMQIEQANLEIESITNDIQNYESQLIMKNQEYVYSTSEVDKYYLAAGIKNIQNMITQRQYDLESKQLEIVKFQKQMGNATVVSEVSGIVKEINEKGIDANGNSAPFMTILQSGEYRVKGSIDEQNIWMIGEGQPVILRSRVDENQTWTGVIGLIDMENPQQSNNNNYYGGGEEAVMASKYPFYIELESADGLILGQHVYIELDQGQEETKEGLWLYGSYIVQEEDAAYVWVSNSRERLEKRKVELGEYDEMMDEYQITSGLTEEDYITFPMAGLYEGVTTVTDIAEQYWEETMEDEYIEGDTMMDDVMMEDMMLEETYDMEMGTEFVEETE